MATLFDRLSGINLPTSVIPAEQKLAIHAYAGAINELRRGKITGGEIATMFSLDAGQVTSTITLKDLLVAAPEKTEFMRVFKDFLYLSETETDNTKYGTQALLVARLHDEVTDQGGTLP